MREAPAEQSRSQAPDRLARGLPNGADSHLCGVEMPPAGRARDRDMEDGDEGRNWPGQPGANGDELKRCASTQSHGDGNHRFDVIDDESRQEANCEQTRLAAAGPAPPYAFGTDCRSVFRQLEASICL
ncbi:hypothetical protein CDD83_4131 [Cordyceps sp. RAO-2017]|nr:hypothetical protein CDD83_4131 [Cordyceps sp. RAO-2017]